MKKPRAIHFFCGPDNVWSKEKTPDFSDEDQSREDYSFWHIVHKLAYVVGEPKNGIIKKFCPLCKETWRISEFLID